MSQPLIVSVDQQALTISCIIPTFNRGLVLCDTIEMLLDQTTTPAEIIIVDQSTVLDDEVSAKLHAWQAAGTIQWLRQVEPNASMARNRGAAASSGDVLLFLDDDIRIGPEFVGAHLANYLTGDVNAVAGQILEGKGEVVYKRLKTSDDPELDWITFPRNFGLRCVTTWMASGNFSTRAPLYFELNGMDENFIKGACREESDFSLRFVNRGYRFQFDPGASIYHLGIKMVPDGGSRPKDMYFGVWNHFFGHWYFILKHANVRTFVPYMIPFVRGFIINRDTLTNPLKLLSRIALWFAMFPVAVRARFRKAPKPLRRMEPHLDLNDRLSNS